MKKYGNVWYHPKAISNILNMRNVKTNNLIIYNSDSRDRSIVVNKRPGENDMIFMAKKRWTLVQLYEQQKRGIYSQDLLGKSKAQYSLTI